MSDRTLLTMPQVAERLGLTPDWFVRKLRTMQRDHGFPGPVPGLGKRWDPRAIDCWLDAQMQPALRVTAQPGPIAPPEEPVDDDAIDALLRAGTQKLAASIARGKLH